MKLYSINTKNIHENNYLFAELLARVFLQKRTKNLEERHMSRARRVPAEFRNLRLHQLETSLHDVEALRALPRPRRGWIRAIREALGMEAQQLARRAQLSPSAITQVEKREADESITLSRLRRVADALNADLVYALVPREPLTKQRSQQAQRRARQLVDGVDHTMALEAQSISGDASQRQREELAERLLRDWSSDLWAEESGA